ncbi:MAG: helix-turn-helix transcriptional regulator [Lentisphaerae bacterium]|nr:helix-turn-helix transcriptional regulator [Lentisphaerota bacterium]
MNIITIGPKKNINMDVIKYNFALSELQPFVYDFQQYGSIYEHPGSDMHEAIHLLIMLNGTFDVEIGGSRDLFTTGSIILIAPWEVHGNYIMRNHVRLLSVTIAPGVLTTGLSAIAPWLEALLLMPPSARMKQLNACRCGEPCMAFAEKFFDLASLTDTAVSDASEQRLEMPEALQQASHFVHILQLFIEIFSRTGELTSSGEKHHMQLRLQPALNLLASGRITPLTTARAASECNLSNGYFNLIFKQIYGLSFYAYELKYRLRRAESELRSSNATIKELAQKWGFADASHFSRTFKRFYGIAPANYRL